MLFGNREPRSLVARRRGVYRPGCTRWKPAACWRRPRSRRSSWPASPSPSRPSTRPSPPSRTESNSPGPPRAGAPGVSVTDVGDLTGSGYDDYVVGGPTITQSGRPAQPRPGQQLDGLPDLRVGDHQRRVDLQLAEHPPDRHRRHRQRRPGRRPAGRRPDPAGQHRHEPEQPDHRQPELPVRRDQVHHQPGVRLAARGVGRLGGVDQRPPRVPDRGPRRPRPEPPEPRHRPRLPRSTAAATC